MYICAWLFAADRPPVRHTYPDRAGEIPTSDKFLLRETTRTKKAQVHGIDSEIIVLWSSGIYLRLVHSLIFSVDAFSGWFTNMLNLESFFGFMILVSMALFDRGKLSCTSK